MESAKSRIERLQNIDLEYVKQGREKGIEQNVKEKITIDLLECLGYDKVKDMDFEHLLEIKEPISLCL